MEEQRVPASPRQRMTELAYLDRRHQRAVMLHRRALERGERECAELWLAEAKAIAARAAELRAA